MAVALKNEENLRFDVEYPQFLVPLTLHQLYIVVHFLNTMVYNRFNEIFIEEILAEIIDKL